MYSILKLVGLSVTQLAELEALLKNDFMYTRSKYWIKQKSSWNRQKAGSGGLDRLYYAEILEAKKDKLYLTYTVSIKVMIRSDTMWDASQQNQVQVLAPGYVMSFILRIAEPRTFAEIDLRHLGCDKGEDIVATIWGASASHIDLSGLIQGQLEVGLVIRLVRPKGDNAFFEIVEQRFGSAFHILPPGELGTQHVTLHGTSKHGDLKEIAERLIWNGKPLKLVWQGTGLSNPWAERGHTETVAFEIKGLN